MVKIPTETYLRDVGSSRLITDSVLCGYPDNF